MPLSRTIALAALVALSAATPNARAADLWPTSTTTGLAVCVAPVGQLTPEIVADGAGGFVTMWTDVRHGVANSDLYCRRVSATGDTLWNPNGLAVCAVVGEVRVPTLTPDGQGGFFAAWVDLRSNAGIYAQHIASDGTALWTANGVQVAFGFVSTYGPKICPDGTGGLYVAWRTGGSGGTFVQRITAGGTRAWTAFPPAEGTLVRTGDTFPHAAVADGTGGAIIAVSGAGDIYAQRVNSAGATQWALGGIAVCTATGGQGQAVMVEDGSGGAEIAWVDLRAGNEDIYAQRISSAGSPLWAPDGVAVCTAASFQSPVSIRQLADGQLFLVWRDLRPPQSSGMYCQRLGGDGAPQWMADGIQLTTNFPERFSCTGRGGDEQTIVSWNTNGSGNVFAQKLDGAGGFLWGATGAVVCDGTGDQLGSIALADEWGGAYVVYRDLRVPSQPVLRAQHLLASGTLGSVTAAAPSPTMPARTTLRCAPNPFRGAVTLFLQGGSSSSTRIDVLDARGRLVVSKELAPGHDAVRWDGQDHRRARVAAGAYWVRATTGGQETWARIVRVR